jgi:hypothetical protein
MQGHHQQNAGKQQHLTPNRKREIPAIEGYAEATESNPLNRQLKQVQQQL